MSLDYILLGLLSQPKSGYDLKAEFDGGVASFWPAELSQIYLALKRLTARGLLTDRREPSDKGPERRVYTRTAAGRRALHEWLRGEPRIGDERFAYLGQVCFLGELGDLAETERFLERLRVRLVDTLQALRAVDRAWAAAGPGYPEALPVDDFHGHLTLALGLRVAAARLEWCDESLRRVRERRERQS